VEEVVVRDPDHDVWTLTHVDPFDGYSDVCLVLHTCEEHPSVERQLALCGWIADNSGCEEAYKTELQTTTLPSASVSDELRNCSLHQGWCSTEPNLHLIGGEPLAGYEITAIEGTRNGEPFFCAGDECNVSLLEGENAFTFWALSSYGDSSLMGSLQARVDSTSPSTVFVQPEDADPVAVAGEITLSGVSADDASGLASVELSLDGGANWTELPFAPDGTWSYRWDTRLQPEGDRLILARAWDVAGHKSGVAQVAVHLDRTPPRVDIPDAWPIWEEPRMHVLDSGSGLAAVLVTIDGGRYGVRRWEYRSPDSWLPKTIAWDRRFGDIIAPIGEYPVEVEAWDRAGNRGSDEGLLLIPDPGQPAIPSETVPEEEAASASLEDPAERPAAPFPPAPVVEGPSEILMKPKPAAPPASEVDVAMWGSAAATAAALATAEVLRRRRERKAAERARLAELRRRAAAASSPEAGAARLARIRQRAEQVIAPVRAAILAAAGAAEAARRRAQQARRRPEDWASADAAARAEQAARREARPPRASIPTRPPEGDAWQQIDVLRAQPRADAAPLPSQPPNPFLEPLGFIRQHTDAARQTLRGYAIYNLIRAARQIRIQQVTSTLRIQGPRIDRIRLGLREMVNRVRPENARLLAQSPIGRAVRSLKSWGVAFGLGLNLASDTADYLEGGTDRHEYAAALTIDTGITIAAALIGGAVAGFVSGLAIGFIGGSPIPIVGNISGAAVGGVVGAAFGILAASLIVGAVYSSGIRSFLTERVADLYRDWTEPRADAAGRNR
jgi:hypothetical protein